MLDLTARHARARVVEHGAQQLRVGPLRDDRLRAREDARHEAPELRGARELHLGVGARRTRLVRGDALGVRGRLRDALLFERVLLRVDCALQCDQRRDETDHDGLHRQRRGDDSRLVPPHELLDAVPRPGRTGLDRFVREEARDVVRQRDRRRVAPFALLLDGAHDDPVEVAAQRAPEAGRRRATERGDVGQRGTEGADARRRSRRLDAQDLVHERVESARQHLLGVERLRSGQQLVEQHAERVHVGARVDVDLAEARLLGRHVLRRADDLAELGVRRRPAQLAPHRLRDPEVDHLRDRRAVDLLHEDVRRFEVAVDHALAVRVLHGEADRTEELEPVLERESPLVAPARDRLAAHELHREVGPPVRREPRIEHARDAGMVHQLERAALRLEAREHLARVHAGLDELQRDLARDRHLLPRAPDGAHPARTDLLQQLERADAGPRPEFERRRNGIDRGLAHRRRCYSADPPATRSATQRCSACIPASCRGA
ncbi:MAG: hypothetical protein R3F34_06675 [Planctomycetota bacterium]